VAVEREVRVPDIGDFENVDVIEVLVAPGDRVDAEASLVTLESDKATMEIPAPWAGVVKEISVAVGDQVSQGSLLARMEVAERPPAAAPAAIEQRDATPRAVPERTVRPAAEKRAPPPEPGPPPESHASPSVRRLARELGVDLGLVPGSGRKGRILKDDVQGFVKSSLQQGTSASVPIAGISVARAPEIDFSKFGPTELQPLNRIRRLASANLHRSWVTVPHVTQFDEADVTELDRFRKEQKASAEARGIKLTFLPFVVKACARALLEFPHFNSSLDRSGENLIVKRYVNVGVAVDTEHGLVVPVLRDADQKGIFDLADELQDLSARARDRKLRPADMQGGTFSVSSLGGIGGRFFTPIVNHPEVAILGVSRMSLQPVHQPGDGSFAARLILPLSLSYDHRVIDGADAARFTTRLAQLLTDLRLLAL